MRRKEGQNEMERIEKGKKERRSKGRGGGMKEGGREGKENERRKWRKDRV